MINWSCCRFVVYVNNQQKTTDVVANDGKWHHILFTWSSIRGAWKIYIDGVSFDTGYWLANGQTIKGIAIFGVFIDKIESIHNNIT